MSIFDLDGASEDLQRWFVRYADDDIYYIWLICKSGT